MATAMMGKQERSFALLRNDTLLYYLLPFHMHIPYTVVSKPRLARPDRRSNTVIKASLNDGRS